MHPPCTYKKKENKDKLVSFILGLNDSYVDLKGQIMRMKTQPTLDMTYSMVLMEEQKRSTTSPESNNTTLVAHQTNKKEYQQRIREQPRTRNERLRKYMTTARNQDMQRMHATISRDFLQQIHSMVYFLD